MGVHKTPKPKYKIGQVVTINGNGRYKILEFEKHGIGVCTCCPADPYFMYCVIGNLWVNEDQLFLPIMN